MQWFGWFRAGEAEAFGKELALYFVQEVKGDLEQQLGTKSARKAHKAMERGNRKVLDFRAKHPLNFYKKSRLANAFLWTLKEAGWPAHVAQQMTEWLTLRL